jgi:peptidyl-prolyl cis-trans isomerase D
MMLQKLNEKIQGLVAWVIVLLVGVTFVFFGMDYYLQSKREGRTVAEVNGEPISKHEFDLQYRRLNQLKDPLQWTAMRESQLKAQVLNDLILNSLSIHSAKLNGFSVSAYQANSAILNIPQFQMDGHFSSMKYARALNGALFTPDSFQREVQQGMLLNQQRFAFIGTAFALPNEIEQFVKLYMQTRDYDYTRIPALKFLDRADVKESELQSYYNKHQDVFLSPEMISVKYIKLSLSDIKNEIRVSNQSVLQYYKDHPTQFMLPAQWDLENIVINLPQNANKDLQSQALKLAQDLENQFIKHPESFDDYAKKAKAHTLDQNELKLASNVLPTILAGQTNLDADLVNLTKANMISKPIRTAQGYEIFKCRAYQSSRFRPFNLVEKDIADLLKNEKSQAFFNKSMERLSELSFEHPDSLDKIAKKLNLAVQESPLFSRRGGTEGLAQNKAIIRAAFGADVLRFGNNSEPIQLDHDNVIVLRVNKHVPASKQALVDVKLLIAKKLAKKQAEAEARQMGEMMVAYHRFPDKSKQQMMVAPDLVWNHVQRAARDAADVPPGVNELAFSLPSVGSRSGRTLIGGDYVVVELKQVNPGNIGLLDPEQVASITQEIEANLGMMDYDLYIHQLMSQAKIEKNKRF